MAVKQITLHVRPEFELPPVLVKGTLEEVEEVLMIGSSVQGMIRTRRSGIEIQKVAEQKDAELVRVQNSYQEKLAALREELALAEQEKERAGQEYAAKLKEGLCAEKERVSQEYEEQIRGLKHQYEVAMGKCVGMEAARAMMEESRMKDMAAAVERAEQMMEKVVAAKEAELVRLREAYARLADGIAKQSDEILKGLGKRAANVKTKGSDYEEEFGGKLRRHYGACRGFSLAETRLGSVGHAMDYSMTIDANEVVMWELKNYSSAVPKAEVDKFLRDLKENAQCHVGIMVSRSTDIYGKANAGLLHTEFEDDKMMIYVSKFEEFCGDDEGRVFQMLLALCRVWWTYHRAETKAFDRMELIRELEKAAEDMARRRTEWRRHRAHLDEMSRWCGDLLDESELRLDRLLKRVRSDVETNEIISPPIEIPETVFRDSREERDLGWIHAILRVCSADAEGEIEVRELVELLGAHHKLSKDTLRGNIMSVVRDSAVYKKSVVKYIRGLKKIEAPCLIRVSSAVAVQEKIEVAVKA